jgi:hypothetical protein
MSPPVLVYVIGEPGVGKSTAMRMATEGLQRAPIPGAPVREVLLHPVTAVVAGIELGRRRPGGFSGTDALPMNAVVAAEEYLVSGRAADETRLLLGEGARLGNRRFLAAAADAGWAVNLVTVIGPETAIRRRQARGTHQNPAWVKGAATSAARLASNPPPRVRVHYVDAEHRPEALIAELAGLPDPRPVVTISGGA